MRRVGFPSDQAATPAAAFSYGRSAAALLTGALVLVASAATDAAHADTQRLIVKLRESHTVRAMIISSDTTSALSAAAGVPLEHVREVSGGAKLFRLPQATTSAEAEAVAQQLRLQPNVEFAEPDRPVLPFLLPDDARWADQWNLHDAIAEVAGANLPGAWDITTGSDAIVVAVVDTGVVAHADLDPARLSPGYDFVGDLFVANDGDGREGNPADPGDWVTDADVTAHSSQCGYAENSLWHGTHVAGIIGASSQNAFGVAGINWRSRILPVRVLGKCGGWMSDVIDGARWAAGIADANLPANPNPARVINLSLGANYPCSAFIQNAVNEIRARGVVIVAAAGNTAGDSAAVSPGNCDGVISVAALDRLGNRAYYSSFGAAVSLSAPGTAKSLTNTGLTSPTQQGDDYDYMLGTSVAAPHVSGVASLMLSLNPSLTPLQVQQKLKATARAFPAGSTCTTAICGAGMLDAAAALQSAANTTPPVADAGPDQHVAAGAMITLHGEGSTAHAPASVGAYRWTQTSGVPVTLSDAASENPTFVAPDQPDVLAFQLTVTDDGGLTSAATTRVELGGAAVSSANSSGGGSSSCFIATAAYGSANATEVMQLRAFRDRRLSNNVIGRALVATYYKLSPPFADFIRPHPELRAMVRAGLVPYVTVARWFGAE